MKPIYTNNARSPLTKALSVGGTSCTVEEGNNFPHPSVGEYFNITLHLSGSREVVEVCRCISRAGNVLTIERGQYGTGAQLWASSTTMVEHNAVANDYDHVIRRDGSINMDEAYSPASAQDVTTKGYVDEYARGVVVSETPPPDPEVGDVWFDSKRGIEATWYFDGVTGQWVSSPADLKSYEGTIPQIFTDLQDTPPNYAGAAGNMVKVNPTEDGLIMGSPSSVISAWGDITGDIANQTDLTAELDTREPVIGTKFSAFNKNFAGSGVANTPARSDHGHAFSSLGYMLWKNIWAAGGYLQGDVVRDGAWTMIANKDTHDRAAPQPIGLAAYLYDGILVGESASAKQVIFGNRYTVPSAAYISGYRVNTVAGNQYDVYLIEDPLGAGIASLLISFVGSTSGWRAFAHRNVLIPAGTVFDLVAVVKEPAVTPTTWVGNWNYTTPQNTAIPAAGNIIHANNALGELRVAKTDNDAGDRSVELAALGVGDVINALGASWAIQAIVDSGTYFIFTVVPASQTMPDGLAKFTFETVTATPISYGREVDYWDYDARQHGLLGIDTPHGDIVADGHAYGTDILLQAVNASEDWDVVATVEGGGGATDIDRTYDFIKVSDVVVAGDTYEDVATIETPDRAAGVYQYLMSWQWDIDNVANSAFFRFSTNDGVNWTEIRQEAKDITDSHSRLYGFPKVVTAAGPLKLIFQARKGNAGDVLNIPFCDVIIQRVA